MDSATQRILKIGQATIGLIGLDVGLNQALAKELNTDEAVDLIFPLVSRQNYIPAGMESQYKEAIAKEYRRMTGEETEDSEDITIRVFGSGCVSCNAIRERVIDALMRAGIKADIEQIYDLDEIGRQGITATPALMINGELKIAGIQPTVAQIEAWLREIHS
ncbi:MAG: thioredoxin family protein [Desulfobulbaceae bacterium]|uniref:Thioredoxin family protein n=1 Tax=Candidatus Desulfatifera sulfidica TaxID=2841691 RepID=A0A8J6TDE6_9BACT|nr:thioredoxin family protein [Candidatus Desulfatifera sulfidica]